MQNERAQREGRRWARRAQMLLLGVVVSGLVTACGGGGGGGDSGGTSAQPQGEELSTRQYLPMQVGNRWIYQSSGSTETYTVSIVSDRTVSGQHAFVQTRTDSGSAEALLIEDTTGVRELPGNNVDAVTAALGPLQLLRYPLRVGTSFVAAETDVSVDFDGDGRLDVVKVKVVTDVIGLEALDTAVGRLADCLHLHSTLTLGVTVAGSSVAVPVTGVTDEWLAPGIGSVRSTTSVSVDGGAASTATEELLAYGLGTGRRSESVAPMATVPSGSGTPVNRNAVLTVTFNEDMDIASMASALQVTNASGQTVPGTIQGASRSLRFTPAQPWSTGTYTATLSTNVQDLVGNPLAAPAIWTFAADAQAPALSASSVLEGTVDVPLTTNILLTFTEPVDPASVTTSTIVARYSGGAASTVSLSTTGNTVSITPAAAWQRGESYTIEINGVTDLAGNPITTSQLHFNTDAGRFPSVLALAPDNGNGVYNGSTGAIGDLNGDGRDDVVLRRFISDGVSGVNETVLYLQQPDGRLGTGAVVPLQSGCPAYTLKIADVNGDGRKDLVAGGNCGIEVFLQSSTGTLVSSGLFGTAVGRLLVADLDGDGRLDLVAIPSPDTVDDSILVWLNKVTGWESGGSSQVAALAHVRDVAVGDLDGDGRPDIAFLANMPVPAAYGPAGVLYQRVSGSFSLEWLPPDGGAAATSVAIGDLTGDGKADLAVTRYLGIEIFPQLGDGTLGVARQFNDGAIQPQALKLADINNDGKLDALVVYNASDLSVRLQQSDGTLGPATRYPDVSRGPNPDNDMVALGDVNGDGRLDVLVYGHVFLQREVPVMAQSVGRRVQRGTRTPRVTSPSRWNRFQGLEGLTARSGTTTK